jgi:hypothetical protein
MKKYLVIISLALLGHLTVASAQFSGQIDMKVSTSGEQSGEPGMNGKMTFFISNQGFRMETESQTPMGEMKMIILNKSANPDLIYHLNEKNKTYSETDTSKYKDMPTKGPGEEDYNIQKLGEEKILGYKTQHVMVTRKNVTQEMWVTKEITPPAGYAKIQREGHRLPGLYKALKDAGVDGFALKTIMKGEKDRSMNMEVTKVDKKSLSDSIFEIPSGYKKSEGPAFMGGMSGPQVDNARKQMEESMKKMSPEQRKMMEKMMQKMGGQN